MSPAAGITDTKAGNPVTLAAAFQEYAISIQTTSSPFIRFPKKDRIDGGVRREPTR
jgi:hypothetical protein